MYVKLAKTDVGGRTLLVTVSGQRARSSGDLESVRRVHMLTRSDDVMDTLLKHGLTADGAVTEMTEDEFQAAFKPASPTLRRG